MDAVLSFRCLPACAWTGRYGRIEGDEPVLHLRWQRPQRRWWPMIEWRRGPDIVECWAVDGPGIAGLAEAIHRAKIRLGGPGGGSFLINEFGQVLVPASDGCGARQLVGEIGGRLLFEDPQDGRVLDLADDDGLSTGDTWNRPYVGVCYSLSRYSEIYFWHEDADGGRKQLPCRQDRDLIDALRAIRPCGAVRFIVNPWGLVLTKAPPSTSWRSMAPWEAVYVGRIDYDCWFSKEG